MKREEIRAGILIFPIFQIVTEHKMGKKVIFLRARNDLNFGSLPANYNTLRLSSCLRHWRLRKVKSKMKNYQLCEKKTARYSTFRKSEASTFAVPSSFLLKIFLASFEKEVTKDLENVASSNVFEKVERLRNSHRKEIHEESLPLKFIM